MPVYFATDAVPMMVKIGYASNVQRRLVELQAGSAFKLILRRTIDGGRQTEGALHRRFSSLRIDREWFRWSDEMMSFLPPPETERMTGSPLARAVAIAGGQSKLARRIGKSQGHISSWLRRDSKVPAECVIAVEEATARVVSRHDLRPDIFGPAPTKRAAA